MRFFLATLFLIATILAVPMNTPDVWDVFDFSALVTFVGFICALVPENDA